MQKQFTERISGMSDLNYWERLAKLKQLSLQRRRERYSIIHLWKMLNRGGGGGGGGKALTMTMTPWNLPHGQWSKKLTMTMTPCNFAVVTGQIDQS